MAWRKFVSPQSRSRHFAVRWRSQERGRGCFHATVVRVGTSRASKMFGVLPCGRLAFRIFGCTTFVRPTLQRLSAGGVADEWVTQLLRQGDSMVFKKYSQMKLQMKREALQKLKHQANELGKHFDTAMAT
jgi:hypothetical protein